MSNLCFVFLLLWILTRPSYGAKGLNQCGGNLWQCSDGSCIVMSGRCDNFPDCPDDSDETGCVTDVCNEGQRPCSSGECIDAKKFCDGIVHCVDAWDELAANCHGATLTNGTSQTGTATSTAVRTAVTTTERYTMPWKTWKSVHSTVSPQVIYTSTFAPPLLSTYQPPPPPVPIETTTRPQSLMAWLAWHRQTASITEGPLATTTTAPAKPDRDTTTNTILPLLSSPSNWFDSGYVPTTSRTACVLVDDYYDFCRKSYRGYYRHPQDCKQYIVCEWAFMHICTCPTKTHWDTRLLTCVWDYMSPCITGDDNEIITQEPRVHSIDTSRKPLSTTTKWTEAITSTTTNPTTTTAFIPPIIRLRALPATPAWLKELSEKTLLTPKTPSPPISPSLLTRLFKAIPVNEQNIRINK